jgi:hypothetical protein
VVFTAVAYTAFHLWTNYIGKDLKSIECREAATDAAGGDLLFDVPSSGNVGTLWSLLSGKRFKVQQLVVSYTGGAPKKLLPTYLGYDDVFPMYYSNAVIATGERIELIKDDVSRSFKPGFIPGAFLRVEMPAGFEAGDICGSWLRIEVID